MKTLAGGMAVVMLFAGMWLAHLNDQPQLIAPVGGGHGGNNPFPPTTPTPNHIAATRPWWWNTEPN